MSFFGRKVKLPTDREDNNYILILESTEKDNIQENIICEVISLDLRGNFGKFMSNDGDMRWSGNAFEIKQEHQLVRIRDLSIEGHSDYVNVEYELWRAALSEWKEYYLKEMGFEQFFYKQTSHAFGVLLLLYDKFVEPNEMHREMLTLSIQQAAERYGITPSVVRSECKSSLKKDEQENVTLNDFYEWSKRIFQNEKVDRKFGKLRSDKDNIHQAFVDYFKIYNVY